MVNMDKFYICFRCLYIRKVVWIFYSWFSDEGLGLCDYIIIFNLLFGFYLKEVFV